MLAMTAFALDRGGYVIQGWGYNEESHIRTSAMTNPPTRLVGYARVSTEDQDASLQVNALKAYGVPEEWIYVEKEPRSNARGA